MTSTGKSTTTVSPAPADLLRRTIWLLVFFVAAATGSAPGWAQTVPCPGKIIDLKTERLPEIVSNGGVLSGMIVLTDEQRYQTNPGKGPNGAAACLPQIRRLYQDHEGGGVTNATHPAIPGPTLRARVGDVVQLTFLNHVNLLDFGNSLDKWHQLTHLPAQPGEGCDSFTGGSQYPNLSPGSTPPLFDSMPNCFHGSSTGNLHFHGTHTNPNATGDNVFLGVRPSPRNGQGQPTVTGASVKADFDAFFKNCRTNLQANSLNQWPTNWSSDPAIKHWALGPDSPGFVSQETLLKAFDAGLPALNPPLVPDPRALWPVDAAQNGANPPVWPQYYVGAFPYCFVLPTYKGVGPGLPLMGQSPGTHWYHAHKHGSTALNVANGMTGAFIIEGPSYDDVLNAFYNPYRSGDTKTLWTRQQITMVVNMLGGVPNLEAASGGKAAFSINGQQSPNLTMYAGEVQMWRIVNSSAISGFYLPNLPPGFTWRQLAQDGVQFDDTNYQASGSHGTWSTPIFVAAGNRIDLLVQAPPTVPTGSSTFPVRVAQSVTVSGAQTAATGSYVPFFDILVIARKAGEPVMPLLPHMPARPPFLTNIKTVDPTTPTPRVLVFNTAPVGGGTSQHTINNVKFSEDNPWPVTAGKTEAWQIFNTTAGRIDHPFHIHINPFQVVALFNPNEPLTNTANQVVSETINGKTAPVPRYYFKGTPASPTFAANQCMIDAQPGDSPNKPNATWVPCAKPLVQLPGGPPQPGKWSSSVWWDVFPIPAGFNGTLPANLPANTPIVPGYFTLWSRFVDYTGNYVMHCHILAHEDRGMMMSVEVAAGLVENVNAVRSPSMQLMQHH